MKFEFSRDYLSNESQRLQIAELDVIIPTMYDSLFKIDENHIQKRVKTLENTFVSKNYFEVALDTRKLLAGYHAIRIDDSFGVKIGIIDTLWVAPVYRHLGLGTELQLRGEMWARDQKLEHITTWVHAKNKPMINLNTNMGYEIVHHKFQKKL